MKEANKSIFGVFIFLTLLTGCGKEWDLLNGRAKPGSSAQIPSQASGQVASGHSHNQSNNRDEDDDHDDDDEEDNGDGDSGGQGGH